MLKFNKCEKLPPAQYKPDPRFGTIFGPHCLRMNLTSEQSQSDLVAEIIPYGGEMFKPGSIVFHYGQSIFEGMKAFRQRDGSVAIFRADLHAQRFMNSARRLAMPVMGEEIFLQCLFEYLKFEQESVPPEPNHALYLRPLLIARDEIVKVGRSKTYTFFIISCIAGNYFQGNQGKGARVLVNRQFVRSFPGGLGEVKTAANYAASLGPQAYAETHRCDQVLYLDGIKHEYVDELGGMNFFVMRNGELVTPPLSGRILNGVTRRSIIAIAPQLGLNVREEEISFTQLLKDIDAGIVTEAFACGTAAVVHSISELVVQDDVTSTPQVVRLPETAPVSKKILQTIQDIQRGNIKPPGHWLFPV